MNCPKKLVLIAVAFGSRHVFCFLVYSISSYCCRALPSSFQDYLARLENIRRQNFQERKELQRRMAGVRAPVAAPAQVQNNHSCLCLFTDVRA